MRFGSYINHVDNLEPFSPLRTFLQLAVIRNFGHPHASSFMFTWFMDEPLYFSVTKNRGNTRRIILTDAYHSIVYLVCIDI